MVSINLDKYSKNELYMLQELVKVSIANCIKLECYVKKIEETFVCPDCSSTNTVKNGKSPQGIQKYKCKDCGKTRVMTRNTLMFSSKKKFHQWSVFIESMFAQDSIIVSMVKADISKNTAFRWRIKILNILSTLINQDKLGDLVYLDDTYINKVQKNSNVPHVITTKRGTSNDKICVACAIDKNNNTIIKVADIGRVSSKALINVFKDKIKEQSKVVADSHRSYHKLMKALNVDWKKIPSKKKSIDEYDLELINHLHAQIKDFLYYYKGVSLKYLQGYLSLFEMKRIHKRFYQNDTFEKILHLTFKACGHIRCTDIDNGEIIIV